MTHKQDRKKYQAPKLKTFGDVRDLTRENTQNQISDVPQGELGQLGYSPAAT